MILRAFILLGAFVGLVSGDVLRMKLADGFDYPVGKPDAKGYYKARGMRLTRPVHFGEDWNGLGGGDSDLNDPIYACGDGVVTFAADVKVGWGRVVLIRHAYREPATGQVKYVDSQYGHLRSILVKKGENDRRVVINMKYLNQNIKKVATFLPRIESLLGRFGHKKNFMSKLDLTQFFWQIKL